VVFIYNMEEIFSLPPLGAFDNNYQMLLEFMDTLGNPKFKITGDVDLWSYDIESLGNLVEVEGFLNLYNNKTIESLPDNLQVGGSLDLSFTNIESLPDNLHVGDYLFLGNTPLSRMYSEKEIRKMIEDKGGFVQNGIFV
jgi:hypothetical protein